MARKQQMSAMCVPSPPRNFRSLYGDVLGRVFAFESVVDLCRHRATSARINEAATCALTQVRRVVVLPRATGGRHVRSQVELLRRLPALCPRVEIVTSTHFSVEEVCFQIPTDNANLATRRTDSSVTPPSSSRRAKIRSR